MKNFWYKIWVVTIRKNAKFLVWWGYWVRNKCLLLSTFCTFQTPLTVLTNSAMDQWTNGPLDQWTNEPSVQSHTCCLAAGRATHAATDCAHVISLLHTWAKSDSFIETYLVIVSSVLIQIQNTVNNDRHRWFQNVWGQGHWPLAGWCCPDLC